MEGKEDARSSPKVWASLITNLGYLPGLLTLHYSLQKVRSQFPLVALYTEKFPEEGHKALDARGIQKRKVDYVEPEGQKDYTADPRFYDTWTKLTVFGLLEYERAILLDGDMLVIQNMDELMDIPLDPVSDNGKGKKVFAAAPACACNPAKKAHYPKNWTPENCAFTAQHSDPESAQINGAKMQGKINMLNSGLLVAIPSQAIYDTILAKMEDHEAMKSYDFPDQAILSDIYEDRWVVLPYIYNALKTLRWPDVHHQIWKDDRVKNVHYIWSPKPWNQKPGDTRDETDKWWHAAQQERKGKEKAKGAIDEF